jgi:hypothetical protein
VAQVKIDAEMQAAQARRSELVEGATKAIRLLCADGAVSVAALESALKRYGEYPDIDASKAALEASMEEAVDRARKELGQLMLADDIREVRQLLL